MYYFDLNQTEEKFQGLLAENDYAGASELLDRAELEHPYHAMPHYLRALLERDLGHNEKALDAAERACKLQPDQPLFGMLCAEILGRMGSYSEAMILLEKLLPQTEYPEQILLLMGDVAQVCRRIPIALKHYRDALRITPDFVEAAIELALLLQEEQREMEAIQTLDSILDINPYLSEVWYQMGMLYRNMEKHEAAAEAFDMATAVDIKHWPSHYHRGICLMAMSQHKDALAVLQQALALNNYDLMTQESLGRCYETLKMSDEAMDCFAKLSRQEPDYGEAWSGLARGYESQGNDLEAVHCYQKAVRKGENGPDVFLGLARAEYRMGNKGAAEDHIFSISQMEGNKIYMEAWREFLVNG